MNRKILLSSFSLFVLFAVLSGCASTNSVSKKPKEIIPFTGTDYTELPKGTDGTTGKGAAYVLFDAWLNGICYKGGTWWLRSPANYELKELLVFECATYGWVNCGYSCYVNHCGIVPALCLEN